ncbi:MAG TPA: helix-turn-helix transcriptional regulator [Bauldia sp.]|nr:helix-turn-helix transcriptional regulator [Bauldia sp.]
MTTLPEELALSRLVGELYDAALDPSLWSVVLKGVRDFVGGASAGIVAKDASANRGFLCFDDGSIAPDYTDSYFDRYVGLDPCTMGHLFSTPENPVSTADLIPYDDFQETRFYREWARPQGFVDYMGAAIDKTATTAVVFNVMRHESDGMFDEASRRRMRLVAPHVRRAVVIGNAIELKTAEAASLAEVFDGLSTGVFLTDAHGRIVHSNTVGRAILADGDGLYASSGRLVARHPEARQTLGAALAAAGKGDAAIGTGGIGVPITAGEGEPYAAHVLPLTSGIRREAASSYDAVAALFVHKATINLRSEPEWIARHYGLTPTELRVLLAIVEVGGVPEVAETLGVAGSTVKTHLVHLYAKTGTSRQADLVKLVAGFANPLLN